MHGQEKALQRLCAQWLTLHGIYFECDRMDKRTSGKCPLLKLCAEIRSGDLCSNKRSLELFAKSSNKKSKSRPEFALPQ